MVEQHGTGTDAGLPTRVTHLEGSVDRLHTETAQMQRTLGGVVTQLDSLGKVLTDVSDKLDKQRTRRPNFTAILAVTISALALVAVIGTMAFSPVNQRLDSLELRTEVLYEARTKQAAQIDATSERTRSIERQTLQIQNDLRQLRDKMP